MPLHILPFLKGGGLLAKAPPCFCLVSITYLIKVILTRQKQGGASSPFNKLQVGKNNTPYIDTNIYRGLDIQQFNILYFI